jgi:hypothetical protein
MSAREWLHFSSFTRNNTVMLKLIFGFFLIAHGMIHLMGFSKAFHLYNQSGKAGEISTEISKPMGMAWLSVTTLFLASTLLLFLQNEYWLFLTLTATLFSQVLISKTWKDAWPGTIANLIVLAGILILK